MSTSTHTGTSGRRNSYKRWGGISVPESDESDAQPWITVAVADATNAANATTIAKHATDANGVNGSGNGGKCTF